MMIIIMEAKKASVAFAFFTLFAQLSQALKFFLYFPSISSA